MMKPEIKLYNTLTRQLEVLDPIDPAKKEIKLYVCGPTVYDEAHLGHARCYITWDVLYRFLTFMGYDVKYTRNITDVDDKILNRAKENGEHPSALAQRFTGRFHEVMAQLNTLPPKFEPKATEFVPQMITVIQNLIEKGFAYVTPSGTVYYHTHKKSNYGNLCHQNLEDLQSGARVDVDPEKRSPLDFALWKPAPADEPLVWDVPWENGKPGRPGWHIECSAMSFSILGEQLDIHAGGLDLIFPHHQNEIAQSEAFTGKEPFVKLWMHNGFVNVSGEKMSKSLGNFSTVAKLMETYDANTIRYFLLTHHYSKPVDFNDEALEGASNWVNRVYRRIRYTMGSNNLDPKDLEPNRLRQILEGKLQNNQYEEWATDYNNWVHSMANNLNTPQALSFLERLRNKANTVHRTVSIGDSTNIDVFKFNQDEQELAFYAFIFLSEQMGFDFVTLALAPSQMDHLQQDFVKLFQDISDITPAPGSSTEDVLLMIIKHRKQVREEKNWALSDQIRDQLDELGIKLEDQKDKTTTWTYEPVKTSASP